MPGRKLLVWNGNSRHIWCEQVRIKRTPFSHPGHTDTMAGFTSGGIVREGYPLKNLLKIDLHRNPQYINSNDSTISIFER